MAFPPLKYPLDEPELPEEPADVSGGAPAASPPQTPAGQAAATPRAPVTAAPAAREEAGTAPPAAEAAPAADAAAQADAAAPEDAVVKAGAAGRTATDTAGEDDAFIADVGGGELDAAADDDFDDDELEELNDRIDPEDLDEFEVLVEQGPADDRAGAGAADAAALAGGEIPMLTEVVQVPRYDTEDLPQSLAEVNWGDLGQRVRENVLERLLRRSDALLDAQLQNTLTPVLERAAEAVAHELHDALNRMIRDIVARAVTEELTRLHAEIAKRNRSTRPS